MNGTNFTLFLLAALIVVAVAGSSAWLDRRIKSSGEGR